MNDETNYRSCEDEPVQRTGAVQPHGCLLAFDAEMCLIAASENASAWLGREPVLGAPASEAVGQQLAGALAIHDKPVVAPLNTTFRFSSALGVCPVHVHRNDDGVLIAELLQADHASQIELLTELNRATERMIRIDHATQPLSVIAKQIAKAIKDATGYDRVMVYRFLPDNSGDVIADEREDDLEAFLGLRYPETDIPKQARTLYLASPLRSIHDASYAPAAIRAAKGHTQAKLDLAFTSIRSVSPVHCEYLANIGVTASMSLSLVVDGKLWGLIACHHGTPKSMPIESWPLLRLLSHVASNKIAAMQEQGRFRDIMKAAQVTQFLTGRLNITASLSTALMEGSPNIKDLIDADGVVVSYLGRTHREGIAPKTSEHAIARALADRSKQTGEPVGSCQINTISGLGEDWDPALPGVLAIGFSDRPDDFIAWYRKELTETVRWAGDPNKTAELKDGVFRLTPRSSFAAWEQAVSGTSEAWSQHDTDSATSIQQSLIDVVVRIYQLQEEVDRRTRDLQAFAYATSHDIRKPVQNISMRLSILAEQLSQSNPDIKDTVTAALQGSMQLHELIDGIERLMQSTASEMDFQPVNLNEVLDEIEAVYAGQIAEHHASIERGLLPVIEADRLMITRLLSNLIDNALKYRSASSPVIHVNASYEAGVGGQINVTDNGRGIEPDQAYEALHPFRRLTNDPEIAGGGLGLAICQRIAKRHGGNIFIDPAEGQGTVFTVTLSRL